MRVSLLESLGFRMGCNIDCVVVRVRGWIGCVLWCGRVDSVDCFWNLACVCVCVCVCVRACVRVPPTNQHIHT